MAKKAEPTSQNGYILTSTQTFLAVQPLWITSVTTVKLSILDLYIKIFRVPTFHRVCVTGMFCLVAFWLMDILISFLICKPLAFNWNPNIPGVHCSNEVAAYIVVHCINFAIDVSLAILPLPVLWG